MIGLASIRQAPRAAWATAGVLVVALTISGKNLSEVARLWLPLMPPLARRRRVGRSRGLGGGAGSLGRRRSPWSGLQALILEATIQVVYPILNGEGGAINFGFPVG